MEKRRGNHFFLTLEECLLHHQTGNQQKDDTMQYQPIKVGAAIIIGNINIGYFVNQLLYQFVQKRRRDDNEEETSHQGDFPLAS